MTTVEEFIERAEQRAGLRNWHNQTFRPGLEALVEGIANYDRFTSQGLEALEEVMLKDLTKRLQVDDYLEKHPDLVARPIAAPLFVGGLPRTGTTLMINLLHQDPRRRNPLKWEVDNPVPPATAETLHTDPRCLELLEIDRARVAAGTAPIDIHFEWADDPRECVYIMAQNLIAASYEAMIPMPNYSELFFSTNQLDTYAVHRRMLQVLQAHAPGMWTLKAPSHILWVDAILATYPDAHIVWTHRDPMYSVPSFCSQIQRAHGVYLQGPDLERIRTHSLEYLREHAERGMRASDKYPDRVHHVQYADLVRDPIEIVRSVYEEIGVELTAEAEDAVATWIKEHPQGKLGRHRYSLEQYGLTTEEVEATFEDYVARFDIPSEHAG